MITADEFARAMPLAQLMRSAQIAPDENITRVSLRPGAPVKEGAGRQLMCLIESDGGHTVVLDAATAEELSRR